MKILFVSYFNGQLDSGGTMCSDRNLKSLKSLYGDNNVFLFSVNRSQRDEKQNRLFWNIKNVLVDIFELGFGGLNKAYKIEIMNKIDQFDIDTIFVDSSLFGVLCKRIKLARPKIKIVTFFHNVEYSFFTQNILQEKKYFLFYRVLLAYISEKFVCKYSNVIISLNKRDESLIYSIYKRKADILIPISLANKFNITMSLKSTKDIKIGLFVGSLFFPNVQGIKWFIKNVLPNVDMKLIIVGKDMDRLKQQIFLDGLNIEIYSSVPNLNEYYEKADFVVLPIFSGGGMKVKTAEALMFGKFLIGTKEAFIGYDINEEVGVCCETEQDMINSINNFKNKSKTNKASIELFLESYSYESTLNKFQKILS